MAVAASDLAGVEGVVRSWVAGLAGCSSRELTARLQEIERVVRVVESAAVAVVAEAERSDARREDGHASTAGWCRAAVRWSDAETTARLRSVRLLADVAPVADALAHGRVGVAQVRELARARANPRCGDQLADVAGILLEHAQRLDYPAFRQVVHRWETLADADGAHRSEELTHAHRDATSGWVGRGWHLKARHGTTQATWMEEVFNAFERAEFLADLDAARTRWGCADPNRAILDRSAAQRRADALFAIFTAAAGAPPAGVPEPTVTIMIDPVTFDAALTAAVSDTAMAPVELNDDTLDQRCCQTATGVPVTPAAAVAAAVVGYVRRAVMTADGVVINLGRRSRLFTGSAREAMWIRRMHCVWVGCRSRWCEIDHRIEWEHGGATDQDNGEPMCRRHNHTKQTGLQPRWHPDLGWRLHRPDGTDTGPL